MNLPDPLYSCLRHQCVPKENQKTNEKRNDNVSNIKDKTIPNVVSTATVEKIKKINLRILSTYLLASKRTLRRFIAKKLNAKLNKEIKIR